MAKKNQAVRNTAPQSSVPMWVWLALSFVLGLVAAGFLIKQDKDEDPFYTLTPKPQANAPSADISENSDQPAASPSPTSAPRTIEASKPKYDFYSVLAEREVEVKDAELQRRIQEPAQEPANVRYFVQMGSFPNEAEADGLKAQLALSGIQATITVSKINGKTWYRVRRGPFSTTAEVEVAKRELANNGIQAVALREDGP
jgi:cell division protein FtsN